MIRIRRFLTGLAALIAVVSSPFGALAQQGDSHHFSVSVSPADGVCGDDASTIGWIGYADLECNCSFSIGPDGPMSYQFRAEPSIGGVVEGSPADGKLRAGDVIAAIDGYLITTREGGRRFAQLAPGEPITLTVRRDGRELEFAMTPVAACFERGSLPGPGRPVPPSRPAVTAAPVEPTRGVPVPPRRPEVTTDPALRPGIPVPDPPRPIEMPTGWFGFSLDCADCTVTHADSIGVWSFASYPSVYRVEPWSPAHKAGIRLDDRLVQIDGYELTSLEGGRLFGAVQPGDTVTFRILRNDGILHAQIVADDRSKYPYQRNIGGRPSPWSDIERPRTTNMPEPPAIDAWTPTSPDSTWTPITRFSGVVGDAHILVTGGPVTVNRTTDEVVIQAADVTVRVKLTGSNEEENSLQ